MSDAKSIFLTNENLAFSLPLISVVSIYLYFKFIPTGIALSLIAGVALILYLRKQVKAQKDHKLTNLDENSIRELVGEEHAGDKLLSKAKRQQLKQQRKQVKARLAKDGIVADDDNDQGEDDEDDLGVFAKTTKAKKR
ncbi:hypothetical protein MPSEU_000392200 [Mayamaea pseudoterrestris]|nr:hypothetical protein MPSEU_000392200 [Mayamaea pseudoterrestris]